MWLESAKVQFNESLGFESQRPEFLTGFTLRGFPLTFHR